VGTYRFVTTWRLAAPRERVWDALRDGVHYPQWWPGFERVEVLDAGSSEGIGQHLRITTRSTLPYHLTFETISREARLPDRLVVDAVGELQGWGRWELTTDGEVTTATYVWHVETTKVWMAWLGPLARPLFIWNHHVLMALGGAGLARHLEGRLVGQAHEPSLRLRDWAPLAMLGVVLAAVVGLHRRRTP
jgi:uncharacterized protein YndB with AHSA1/START domain